MKKDIIVAVVYVVMSIILYKILNMEDFKEVFDVINTLGVGMLFASILMKGIDKLSNKLIDSGRLVGVPKVKETKYIRYTFIFGLSSLILSIVILFI